MYLRIITDSLEHTSVNMLNYLLNQLKNVTSNILCIVEQDSVVTIDYAQDLELTEVQNQEINNILNTWPLTKAKLAKIETLDNNWKIVLKNGWTTPDGYKLGIDIQDITLLNGAFTLAKEASLMGINAPTSIVDIDGMSHSLLLPDLTILMLQYGQARAELSGSYAAIKQSINSATSIEEVDSIDLTIGA